MNIAYLSIGSNKGNRFAFLKGAIQALRSHPDIRVSQISSIYETAPVGFTEQEDFLNIAIEVETSLSAEKLLTVCQAIEKDLGRVREKRWGPRTVDLDILLFNNDNIESENLTIPHPRMMERAFVLVPLVEIAPTLCHPVTKERFAEANALQDAGVHLWKTVDEVVVD